MLRIVILVLIVLSSGGFPPIAKTIPEADTLHGDIRIDNYSWLEDRNNPEVIKYLEAENRYAEMVMSHTEELQAELYEEFLFRIKETDLSLPEKINDYYYYSRTEKGKQYFIYCRKKGSLNAKEEIILDENLLARGYDYLELGIMSISPDHSLLAYSIDTTGSERYTLYIKDLNLKKLLKDEIPNTGYSAEWANDNKTLFYTVLDSAKRPCKLYKHTLGTPPEDDIMVYKEDNEAFFIYISKTKSRKYLLLNTVSHITSEAYYLSADHPEADFNLIHPREKGVEYYVHHHRDRFFILTNYNAKNFRLMEVPLSNPSRENWKDFIPYRDSIQIEDIEIFEKYLVVCEREKGLQKLRIINLTTDDSHYVEFKEPVYTFWTAGNRNFDSNLLRFYYTSFITPLSIFDCDMDKKTLELKKQKEVLGGYEPSLYQSERVYAPASDGTIIPLSLVYKKDITKNGNNPLLLWSYGSYGDNSDPYFSSTRLSLLDRGFIYVIAHTRGGGEMGRDWYEGGKMLTKKNTFTDFIACAEYLIGENYTSSEKLVIEGQSAGGLLVGAVVNMKPDLFKVVIARVPFVDALNTMLDASLPLTVLEYEEWGNPNYKEYYEYIKSYSPYDNVEAKNYPCMLITAGLNDTRVSYWEPAKWAARLRALKTDNNLLLLKTNMGSGHAGKSGRYDYLRELAFEYAFILDRLGIVE